MLNKLKTILQTHSPAKISASLKTKQAQVSTVELKIVLSVGNVVSTEPNKRCPFRKLPRQILQLLTGTRVLGESVQFDGSDPWLAYPYVDSEGQEIRISI